MYATQRRFCRSISILLLLISGCSDPAPEPQPQRVAAETPAAFVGRDSCVTCHEQQAMDFTGSDHDLAMQPATDETVLANFNDSSITIHGVTSTFRRSEDQFLVRTDGPDGAIHEYRVAYTFGVRPLQQYLVEMPHGRYQMLPLGWDTTPVEEGGQRWFHVYGDEKIDHRDELHWTRPLQNWNYMCAECHSTRLEKGYVAAEDRFETTWSEIDVSCEACHGPGSRHVAWAHRAASGAAVGADEEDDVDDHGLIVDLRLPADTAWLFDPESPTAHRLAPLAENTQTETCGRCHSRRGIVWPEYEYGQPLADTHRVSLLDEHLYYADGQIHEEVFVYGSFVQSKMYQRGVTCSDCHEPHGAGLLTTSNGLCARCHLADVFDTPEHHFHADGSTGAQCVECHMPESNFMVIDPRRDHSLRIPRPDLSLTLGSPNACTNCHEDQSAQWAADAVREWYGPARAETPHYGHALHAGRHRLPGADAKLLTVIDDQEMPAIVRATALELLRGQPTEASTAAIIRALTDPVPLVRRAGAAMLDRLPPDRARSLGLSLLSDPVRTVRLEAVLSLAGSIPLQPEQPGPFDRAVAEYRTSLETNADRAESHLNLGNLEAQLGNAAAAEQAYRAAQKLEPDFAPAQVNLADLFRATGREAEGEALLRESLARRASAEVHHALGLSLIRKRDVTGALEHLGAAAQLRPDVVRYPFVYAIALHDLGRAAQAVDVLEQAQREHPGDPGVLNALVTYCRELGRAADAANWAAQLEGLTQP